MGKMLSAAEAAERVGITLAELMVARARGLPPGTLGRRAHWSEPLMWDADDLLPAPEAIEETPETVCPVCGRQFKSARGVTQHQRVHG